ncbi:polygalacturonase [Marinilabilia salmonicolor]|jgi:polygalacturonase|uniref:glycoside hydrolase family 28 protein n=1 Tax=Marinilabilia salmonicolor TaxID=989 RepID=UPI000D0820D9|nr:glycoside hydrolase family 28 protein [Marinilabilia salmonicolor]PRY99900.1 polygalacturonase [Marinilabilia salmonicolor]
MTTKNNTPRQKNKKILFAALVFSITSWMTISGQDNKFSEVPHDIAPVEAPFEMPVFERPVFPDQTFDIKDFGAVQKGSNNHKITDAIHLAIDAAAAAGGGKVLIPEGEWLTGPIHLKSNINLHFEEGASLFFSENKEDYLPVVKHRYEGVEAYNYSSLIYANNVENVAITGKGILEGQGEHWLNWSTVQPRAEATKVPLSRRKNFGKGAGKEGMRPSFVVFWKSRNIFIEGITLRESPMWNIHLIYSNHIVVRDITIHSVESHNGDGIVLDSSGDALLEYNHLSTGDDAIVLKSGFNEEGLEINIPTENVVIRNYYAYDVRTGSGGVVFGSETSGGIKNVYVHDAIFEKCDRGIRFKTARGRGNVTENIIIRDVQMKNIRYEAINFNTAYTGAGVGPSPLVRNIDIRNVKINGVPNAIVLNGLPEKWIENIYMENISAINVKEGIRLARVKNLVMKDIRIESESRAMIADDVYEVKLENLELKDQTAGNPVLLKGRYSGAIIAPDFSEENVDFEEGAEKNILIKDLPSAAW